MSVERASKRISEIEKHLRDPTTSARCLTTMDTAGAKEPVVLEEHVGTTSIITLNRPSSLNALNVEIFITLRQILKKTDALENIKLIILRGSGQPGRAFCAGGDVKELSIQTQKQGFSFVEHFFTSEYSLDYLTSQLKTPVVALWDGIVMGGGAGISMYSPFKIATEKTVYAMPECSLGLFPDVGGSYFLSRMPWPLGLYLGLSTGRLNAGDVMNFGIATHFVEHAKIPNLVKDLSSIVIEKSKTRDDVINIIQNLLTKYTSTPPTGSLEPHWAKIQKIFSQKSVENIVEELKKDNSEWSNDILKKMLKCSPTSLKVCFQQIHAGKDLSILDNFKMEYRLALRFLQAQDFHSGVKANLIDRTDNPIWKPSTLSEVTTDDVNAYFAPLAPKNKEFSPIV